MRLESGRDVSRMPGQRARLTASRQPPPPDEPRTAPHLARLFARALDRILRVADTQMPVYSG